SRVSPEGARRSTSGSALDQTVKAERTFLAHTIALPEAGAAALSAIDPDELLTRQVLRRAARHIATRTDSPLADLPSDDDELARAVADLVNLAGRVPDVSVARLY